MSFIEFLLNPKKFFSQYDLVINIVNKLEDSEDEGWWTNTSMRASSWRHIWHEVTNLSDDRIEVTLAYATPLCCPINRVIHEHGCYNVSTDLNFNGREKTTIYGYNVQ